MNNVASKPKGVGAYQDGFITHGSDKADHDQRLISLLRRLIQNISVHCSQTPLS